MSKFFEKPIKNMKLLYRASEEDFSVDRFHSNCDGVKNTVVLLENEFGSVLGGYTPLSWKSTEKKEFEDDESMESFLFSVTSGEKFPLLKPEKAISFRKDLAPHFGAGCDLFINSHSKELNKKSGGVFPHSYGRKVENNDPEEDQLCLFGSPVATDFNVKNWEVFEVQFDC